MDQFGKIIDPLNCKQDILDGRVVFVGCPSQRIQEDALRILRFYRFNAYFGCGSAEPKSLKHVKKMLIWLAAYLEKGYAKSYLKFTSENVCDTLELMQDGSILKNYFPQMSDWLN